MTTRDDVFGHQDHRQTGTMIMTGENHPPRIIKQAATEVTAVLVLAVQEVLAVVMIPGTTLILGKNQSSSNNDNRNGGVVTLTTTISLLLAIVLLQGRETSTTMMIGVPLGTDRDGSRVVVVALAAAIVAEAAEEVEVLVEAEAVEEVEVVIVAKAVVVVGEEEETFNNKIVVVAIPIDLTTVKTTRTMIPRHHAPST